MSSSNVPLNGLVKGRSADDGSPDINLDFREIVESSLQGLIVHRGEMLWVNRILYDLLEIDPDVGMAEGTSVFEFIHEDDVEAVRKNVSSRLTGEEIRANYGFRIRTKTGRVVYVGDTPLPGALDAVERLRQAELPLRFLTNTTRRSARRLRIDLAMIGLRLAPDEVLTPAQLARAHLVRHRLTPHRARRACSGGSPRMLHVRYSPSRASTSTR